MNTLIRKIIFSFWNDPPYLNTANVADLTFRIRDVNQRVITFATLVYILAAVGIAFLWKTILPQTAGPPPHSNFTIYFFLMIGLASLYLGAILQTTLSNTPLPAHYTDLFICVFVTNLAFMTVSSQLHYLDISVMCVTLYAAGALLLLRRWVVVLIYLVIPAATIIGLLLAVNDPITARVNATSLAVHSLGGLILARSMFNYRYKSWLKMTELQLAIEQMDKELSLAEKVQKQILPAKNSQIGNFTITSATRPLRRVTGDFFDFIHFGDNNRVGIFLADVAGHGLGSALVCSMLKSSIYNAKQYYHKPAAFLQELSDSTGMHIGNLYFTAFYGILDSKSMTLNYARAGHTFPYLIRNQNLKELDAKGFPGGVYEDLDLEEEVINLNEGDKLLLFSDGYTEERNLQDVAYEDFLKTEDLILLANREDFSASVLYKELEIYKDGAPFRDDFTLICVKVGQK